MKYLGNRHYLVGELDAMLCTFCGTENSPQNKFCGMCGVKLERRKLERRVRHGAASLKCASCGNISEPGNTFCGMCGARIERRLSDRRAPEDRATAIANFTLPSPEVEKPAAPDASVAPPPAAVEESIPAEAAAPRPSPEAELPAVPPEEAPPRPPAAIFRSAPAEPPAPAERSTISGPSFLGLNDAPANSGDYLLEDEEPSGHMVRTLVFVGILAVVLGLMFFQWRSNLRAGQKPPGPSKPAPAMSPTQEPQPKPEASPALTASTPSAAEPTPSPATAGASDKTVDDQPDSPKPTPAVTTEPSPDKNKADNTSSRAAKNTAKKEQPREEAASLRPSAGLVKAQDYLQGRNGVKQDCDQGMVYLRAAVQRSEPAAAMQMGELYATGRCVQQDRVMAYRWMNSAREKAPGNVAIQTAVDQLWGRMTPQERKDTGH
jgi:hypothetical protein